ncbi:hypothetical protein [Nonomuraea aurantiaca]|uniref:hypothetical protein n=1 Tax=Nonomuraea aurantiaca TaxID=2878562 RepID=UPI001CD9886B|nr:hypothetical protein [Nonomuraea aurantiaca]MCA2224364.1 hypothetical protein [Nonomuraea aurantiaca]
MKLMITALTAGVAVLVSSVPAQAAPKNPVAALKAQLVAGHGVRFTDVSAFVGAVNEDPLVRRTGSIQFGKKGITGWDITGKFSSPLYDGHNTTPERTIAIGDVAWVSGGTLSEDMPKGKTWFKTYSKINLSTMSSWFGQVVSPAEPATLAALVKNGKLSGSTYRGQITFTQLFKISPWFSSSIPMRSDTEATVTYALKVDAKGLPSQLTTTWKATDFLDISWWEDKAVTIETRYTGWGAKVSIKSPPASKITTKLND